MDGAFQPLIPLGVAAPAGNMYTTGNDMAKWMSLFFRDDVPYNPAAGQILDGASIREMLTRRALTNPTIVNNGSAFPTAWGFPWEVSLTLIFLVAHRDRPAPSVMLPRRYGCFLCSHCQYHLVVLVSQVYTARTADPAMASFSQFDIIGKDGAIGGFLSQLSLVPELKTGVFSVISTGVGEEMQNYGPASTNIAPFYAVPLVFELMAALNSDPNPPIPSNINDYIGNVGEANAV